MIKGAGKAMDSPKKDSGDSCNQNPDEDKALPKVIPFDHSQDQWDEWYDDSELSNKDSKRRRSKKRLHKQQDEW
jgi:hypothetical protein